jgi:hypothetical protein
MRSGRCPTFGWAIKSNNAGSTGAGRTRSRLSPNASTRHYTYTAGIHRLANIRIGSTTGTVESSFTHDFEGRLTAQSGVGAKTL